MKGLTQGNDGGSSKRPRSPAPAKSASPHPVKRPRPAQPLPPVQDDDIQEVVPVKTEPAVAAVTSYAGAGASQEQQVAAYEDENYAEYGEYEDQQGYTDTGMVDFNQSMDGNKGKTNMQTLSLKLRHFLKTELCFISDLVCCV